MQSQLIIAVDAMGGDHGPDVVVAGVKLSRARHPDVRYQIFGDEAVLRPLMDADPALSEGCSIHHCGETVTMDARPSQAVRRRDSSMWRSIESVARGEASVVVSAGNTGALMAMSVLQLRTLDEIKRPAIASLWPNEKGQSAVLDLGANVRCDADDLVDFAVMGAALCRVMLGRDTPSIGLLNIGEEELKGNEVVKSAAQKLREVKHDSFSFSGFVEGSDLWLGTVDVVVSDGFSGNIALKTAEGTVRFILDQLRQAFRSSLMARIGYLCASRALGKMRQKLDPRAYNGGVFLGLNGLVVKSHGGTDEVGFAHALDVAIDMAEGDLMIKLANDVKAVNRRLHLHENDQEGDVDSARKVTAS